MKRVLAVSVALFASFGCDTNLNSWLAGAYVGPFDKQASKATSAAPTLFLNEDGSGIYEDQKLTWTRPPDFTLTVSPEESSDTWEFQIVTQVRREGTFLWQRNGPFLFWKTGGSRERVLDPGILERVRKYATK